MDKKKAAIYLVCYGVAILLFLFIFFLSYVSAEDKLKDDISAYNNSIRNTQNMEALFYSQALIVPQYLTSADSSQLNAFQSYVKAFQKAYASEFEKASTMEEINYVFQINTEYNRYIDTFANLQNYDLNTEKGYNSADLYYRLDITPQTSKVLSSLQTYQAYLQTAADRTANKILEKGTNTLILFTIFLFLVTTAVFLVARSTIKKSLEPLYSILDDQHKFEKAKSDFFSTISHEFKTPLTSIVMGADLLENLATGELNKDQQELVATIKEDSFVLTNLVNNMLQLSKIESSDVVYSLQHSDIIEIIRQSMSQFVHLAQKMNIAFDFSVTGNMPLVNVDSDKIVWVVNNLLSNAFKYSKEGDRIQISAEYCSEEYLTVKVTDQGPGIPTQYSEKIFEKYFQVNDSDIELGGTGLGLAIAKDIINYHGGDIWCTQNHPRGSVFTFTLPVLNHISLEINN